MSHESIVVNYGRYGVFLENHIRLKIKVCADAGRKLVRDELPLQTLNMIYAHTSKLSESSKNERLIIVSILLIFYFQILVYQQQTEGVHICILRYRM